MSRKPTRAELEQATEQYSRDYFATSQALNAFMRGETSEAWRKGDYTVRACEPNGAHGGIVMVTFAPRDTDQRAHTQCHYFEAWFDCVARHCGDSDEARELRELAYKAQTWIRHEQTVPSSPAAHLKQTFKRVMARCLAENGPIVGVPA
jgi:hypothetical protein